MSMLFLPGQKSRLGQYLDNKKIFLDNSDMYCLMTSHMVCLHICF